MLRSPTWIVGIGVGVAVGCGVTVGVAVGSGVMVEVWVGKAVSVGLAVGARVDVAVAEGVAIATIWLLVGAVTQDVRMSVNTVSQTVVDKNLSTQPGHLRRGNLLLLHRII